MDVGKEASPCHSERHKNELTEGERTGRGDEFPFGLSAPEPPAQIIESKLREISTQWAWSSVPHVPKPHLGL